MKPIQANIKHLRSLKKLSQARFADDLGWTRSVVGSYEEGRSEPPIERLIDLSNYFNIPIDILVRKDLRKAKDTSFIEVGNKRVLFPVTVNEDNEDLIEIIAAKASAGYLSGYDDPEYIEQLQKIKLPFLPTGTHRAFPIKGDSMLPVKDGAFVVAKFVEDIEDIRNLHDQMIITKSQLGTLASKIIDDSFHSKENVVKVITNKSLDVSKFPEAINFLRNTDISITNIYHHLGIYCYRAETLKNFVSYSQSKNEIENKLEQLRALDNNMKINVALAKKSPIGVDTNEDFVAIKKIMEYKPE